MITLLAVPLSSGGAPRPARLTLVRLRIVLTTDAPAADLTLDPGTIINASVVADDGSMRVRADRNHLSFVHDGGDAAEAKVRLLLSGIPPDSRMRWQVTLSSPGQTQLEIYNENDQGRARLVDRFQSEAENATFDSSANLLLAGNRVEIRAGPGPLVLAFFYPWYQHFNWASDRLLDQPLFAYSTEMPDEVARSLVEARAAGLDGLVVSWRGDTDWNERRLRIVLDQASKLGLKISILVETPLAVGVRTDGTKGLVADKIRAWLERAFDLHSSHPAFLRTGGRPVMFVYAADRFAGEEWSTIIRSLDQSGRNIFLIADSADPALLDSFNGAFTYATAGIPRADLAGFYSDQALWTESYDLSHGGPRRVDAAAVSPGYDDSRLDRGTKLVVGRENGARYDAQWRAALAAQPDWILITSWNEFWENTHVEPSVLYGRQYQDRTRAWSSVFRRQRSDSPVPPR